MLSNQLPSQRLNRERKHMRKTTILTKTTISISMTQNMMTTTSERMDSTSTIMNLDIAMTQTMIDTL